MPKLKSKFIIAIFLCSIIVITSGFLFLRLHNGIVIKADGKSLFFNQAPLFRQDDETWADDLLGESSYTMKSSGCLTSCIASAISAEVGNTITPGELNKIFSDNDVYDIDGNIQWAEIEKLDGYEVKVFNNVSETDIYQCLTDGHYPIARVRMNGLGNYHYVLIVGIQNDDYICMDPLKNEFTKLSDYWNRIYAVRVVYSS